MIVVPECASAHIRGRYKSKTFFAIPDMAQARHSGMTGFASRDAALTRNAFASAGFSRAKK
jgi:hypothetical protein